MPQWTAKSLSAATKPSTAKSISRYILYVYIYINIHVCNWFLIYSQNCANIITVNLETFHLLKVTLYPLTAPHCLPISSSLKQPLIYCLCGFAYPSLSCECNHIVCDLCDFFHLTNVFKVYPCIRTLIPFMVEQYSIIGRDHILSICQLIDVGLWPPFGLLLIKQL